MVCNWGGTSQRLRRWSTGLCCAAGLFAGEQLFSAEPADDILQQYRAAMQRVAIETSPATEEPGSSDAAAEPAPIGSASARPIPFVNARPITASPSSTRQAAAPTRVAADKKDAELPPIVTPLQAKSRTKAPTQRQETTASTTIAPVVSARPSNATLPPARNSVSWQQQPSPSPIAPSRSAAPFHQQSLEARPGPAPLRMEPGQTTLPIISVPLVESATAPASREPAPAAIANQTQAIAQHPAATPPGAIVARQPEVIQNPLVGARKPLAAIAPSESAEVEKLAPIVAPAKLPANILPKTEAPKRPSVPAAPVLRPAQVRPVQFESPVEDAAPAADPIALHGYAPPKAEARSAASERTIPALAIEPIGTNAAPAATQAAALQPLPAEADAEFGQLPEGSPFETIGEAGTLKLRVRRSMLLRTKVDVYRTATVDEAVVELVQFTPREVSLIGRSQGQTHITFWFNDPAQAPVTYLVEVAPDAQAIAAQEEKYKLLENVINEMFPDSKVYLVLVADKLLVKGQARDSEEAAQIMTIIRAQAGNVRGGMSGGLTEGLATPVLSMAATGNNPGPGYTIINMLRVPGVQQVALKVKIAELNRSAARGFGVNVAGAVDIGNNGDELIFASILNGITGGGTSVIASLDGGDLDIGIRYLQQRGVIRLLSEPTLVTLSGRPATFIAGGEFAVPTIVGNVGLNAVTTDFRAFGAIISFVPTVVDKDRIRLQVAPEFSQINNQLAVGGTPGLNVRAATTTVEMREGQTLAIAGLLEDNFNATTVGDLPFLAQLFGRRTASHNETELIILVTPELVQPMEPEEVPPLPGFDITEPTGGEFFLGGHIEGNPTRDHRSTVWPRLKRRYGMGGPAMTSGPFGHGQ